MSLLAVHLNDAGITVLSAERLLYREPAFALLEDEQLTIGNAALAAERIHPRRIQNHFWDQLHTEPLADHRFSHLSTADLVSRQLEQIWQTIAGHGDRLVVAVPAYMDSDKLALFLGIAAELDVPVVALVDAAVAATRRQYEAAVPAHVDVSLHGVLLTRLAQDGQVLAERSTVLDGDGMLALYDTWLRGIAEAFVQQSRFDPLHTAETEQLLLNRMPGWLADACSAGTVRFAMEYRGIEHQAELESLELIAMVAPAYQRIVGSLRALYRADEVPAIQLSHRAAQLPGLADMLSARVGGEVYLLEAGATARGLLNRCRDMQGNGAGVSLIRQLPWDQSAVAARAEANNTDKGQPSHLLFTDTAYAISQRALVLGTQGAGSQQGIELQQDMPGVSRQHCSVRYQNGQCIVEDHSRYGTFLNGHRINGSAVLAIGDQLRIGTPGYELRLITVEGSDGS